MKKIIIVLIRIVLSLFFLWSTLAGCSSRVNTEENASLPVKKFIEATLTFYFESLSGKFQNPDISEVINEIEKRANRMLNIKLNFKWIESINYADRIKTLLSSGDNFDAFSANADFPAMAGMLGEGQKLDDFLLDITEFFPEYAPGLYASFSEAELAEASYNGRIMAIPHHMPGSYRQCAVVREDFMEKYNIPDIKNFDDYEKYLKYIKENEPGVIPSMYTGYSGVEMLAESYGYYTYDDYLVYKWDDPEITFIPWENTPEFKISYNLLQKWVTNGYISNGTAGYNSIITGRTASFITNFNDGQYYSQALSQKYRLKVYPLNTDQIAPRAPITTSSIIFNKNAGNPERVIMFIEWLESSQENYDLLMYGIKDKNYSLNANGQFEYKEELNSISGWWGSDAFSNIDYCRPLAFELEKFKEEYQKNMEQNTKYPPTTGFIPNKASIKSLIDIRNEKYGILDNNIRDGIFISNVDNFIKEQETAGSNKIANEIQKQLDKWRKK